MVSSSARCVVAGGFQPVHAADPAGARRARGGDRAIRWSSGWSPTTWNPSTVLGTRRRARARRHGRSRDDKITTSDAALQIYDRRERALVGAADAVLAAAAALARRSAGARVPAPPRRILLLRLERIGDLLMALPAHRRLSRAARPPPRSTWSSAAGMQTLARAIPAVTRVVHARRRSGWRASGAGDRCRRCCDRRAAWRGAPLRSGDQLRARHPQQPPARRSRRRVDGRVSQRRRRRAARSGARVRPGAHTTENARRLVPAVFGACRRRAAVPLLMLRRSERAACGGRCDRQRTAAAGRRST